MRTIDHLLDCLDRMDGLSTVEREILRLRIEKIPTREEIDAARLSLAPEIQSAKGWRNNLLPSYIEPRID